MSIKKICLEFGTSTVVPVSIPDLIVSKIRLSFFDRYILCDLLPIKKCVWKLAISKENRKYYVLCAISNSINDVLYFEHIYYLECSLGHKQIINHSMDKTGLNLAVSLSGFRIFFNFDKGEMQFFLSSKKDYRQECKLAVNEGFFDTVFVINPNIVTLIEDLNDLAAKNSIALKILKNLSNSQLNPAREIISNNWCEVDKFPPYLRNRLINELFIKRDVDLKN